MPRLCMIIIRFFQP